MNDLLQLLTRPIEIDWSEKWNRLTRGTALFDTVARVARSGAVDELRSTSALIEDWRRLVIPRDGPLGDPAVASQRLRIVDDLLHCGIWAAEIVASRLRGRRVAGISGSLPTAPEASSRLTVWAHTFVNEPAWTVRAPLALYDEGSGSGVVGTLVLELCEGDGHIALHPADAFETVATETFHASLARGWQLAREELGAARNDCRWRDVYKRQVTERANDLFLREADITRQLHHPNVVCLLYTSRCV